MRMDAMLKSERRTASTVFQLATFHPQPSLLHVHAARNARRRVAILSPALTARGAARRPPDPTSPDPAARLAPNGWLR